MFSQTHLIFIQFIYISFFEETKSISMIGHEHKSFMIFKIPIASVDHNYERDHKKIIYINFFFLLESQLFLFHYIFMYEEIIIYMFLYKGK